MARLLKSSFGIGINLDGNVGPKGGNERSDVGAVQFALLLLTSGSPLGGGGSFSVPAQGPIAVDGFFGPQTAAYIDTYQAIRVRSPGPSTGALPRPDGNFNNFRRSSWNFDLLATDVRSRTGNEIVDLMRSDSRCPAFLRPFFLE